MGCWASAAELSSVILGTQNIEAEGDARLFGRRRQETGGEQAKRQAMKLIFIDKEIHHYDAKFGRRAKPNQVDEACRRSDASVNIYVRIDLPWCRKASQRRRGKHSQERTPRDKGAKQKKIFRAQPQ